MAGPTSNCLLFGAFSLAFWDLLWDGFNAGSVSRLYLLVKRGIGLLSMSAGVSQRMLIRALTSRYHRLSYQTSQRPR